VLRHDATIPVKVSALTVDPFTSLPVVILADDFGRTSIPISIGLSEASAIATELDKIELERPMTHQLFAAMLAKAGVEIEAVEVHDLVEGTFYAIIYLSLSNGESIIQDARPSDALALALHTGADIVVATRVVDKLFSMESCQRGFCECQAESRPVSVQADEATELLEGLGDEAFGKWKV
jgi:bifunctional DNase/RNase